MIIKEYLKEKYIEYNNKKRQKKLFDSADILYKNNTGYIDTKERYLIAQQENSKIGLFAFVCHVMGLVDYAINHNYLLSVDMKNYPNNTLSNDKLGIDNAWEYYFEQPMNIDLDVAYKSKNSFMSPKSYASLLEFNMRKDKAIKEKIAKSEFRFPTTRDYIKDKELFVYWCEIFSKYIRFNNKTKEYIQNEYTNLFIDNMKVLGVSIRGAGYTKTKPFNHPIQPSICDVIERAKKALKEWDCEYIYLSCEEEKVLNKFKEVFPNKILTNKRKFLDEYGEKGISYQEIQNERDNDEYLSGLEYISSIYMLSQCDSLIAGLNGGSQAAMLMNNNNYKNVYLYDLGNYGIDDI